MFLNNELCQVDKYKTTTKAVILLQKFKRKLFCFNHQQLKHL